jgi:YkoY family integral membrane protein
MLHQTFAPHDLFLIVLLVVLEGMLSMDNAVVLGLLARRLPEGLRAKALTYGLVGSLILRIVAIGLASFLLRWRGLQMVGGVFLMLVALKHLRRQTRGKHPGRVPVPSHAPSFWATVGLIELTDVAFAVDSILAAVALVGPAPAGTPPGQLNPKFWVVVVGGMGGVVLMRFAAFIFIKLLMRFPRLEVAAYLLVMVIGAKMAVSYLLTGNRFADVIRWTFWALMAAALALGFVPRRLPHYKPASALD